MAATAVLATLAAVVATGCSGGKAGPPPKHQIVLTLASETAGPPEQLQQFVAMAAQKSGGTIRIELKDYWRQGDVNQERHTIADVRTGKVDMAWIGARAWDSVGVTSFDALVAPFLIDSNRLEQRVFAAKIPQHMLAGVSRAGVVPIGVLPGPLRMLLGVNRRLVAPADFRDARIGVQGVIAAETFRALGAAPRELFAQPSLAGLDGIEEQMSAIVGNGHVSRHNYLTTGVALWPRPLVLFAARRAIDSLSPAQRSALRDAAAASVSPALGASAREDSEAARALCREGLPFVPETPEDARALGEAVAPVYRKLDQDSATRNFVHAIQMLKTQTTPEPPPRCGRASGQSGPTTSPLDGTWVMKVTRADLVGNPAYKLLREPGHPTAEDLRLDPGDYRMTFHAGHVVFSLHGGGGDNHETGTFRVKGKTVVFQWDNGNDAGETWTYSWSIYRGLLTYGGVPGQQVPPNPAFAPWHRVAK